MDIYTFKKACAWSGVVSISLFFLAFLVAGFIPPPGPSQSAVEVATHYQEHVTGIRLGMVMLMISGMFMAPYTGEIAAQIKRMEGVPDAVRYGQIAIGGTNAVFFIVPALFIASIAFRPDRPPEMTLMMNDYAWIMAILPWSPQFMQNLLVAMGILMDKSDQPVFPRWLAYANIWIALAFIPGSALVFFKTGPFSWPGILVFWLAGSTFIIWFIVMTVGLLKAIEAEKAAA